MREDVVAVSPEIVLMEVALRIKNVESKVLTEDLVYGCIMLTIGLVDDIFKTKYVVVAI